MGLLLALVMGLSVWGAFAGIRMYRAEAKLPGDLALALEVGSTRTGAVDSLIDRMGMRYAPAVLRLMGPKQVAKYRRKIDLAGNPCGLTIDRYAARRAVYGFLGGVGSLFLMNGVKDGALDRMTGSTAGQACVIIAFALYTVGFVLIRRMSRIDV